MSDIAIRVENLGKKYRLRHQQLEGRRYKTLRDVLANAPEATVQIRQEIELARNQWVFYEAALAQRGADTPASERSANVFLSSENILSVMDKVTGLYARLAT